MSARHHRHPRGAARRRAVSNAKHWNDNVITEVKEFEGPHMLPASPGWEKVADYALDWARDHSALPSTG